MTSAFLVYLYVTVCCKMMSAFLFYFSVKCYMTSAFLFPDAEEMQPLSQPHIMVEKQHNILWSVGSDLYAIATFKCSDSLRRHHLHWRSNSYIVINFMYSGTSWRCDVCSCTWNNEQSSSVWNVIFNHTLHHMY